MYQFLVIAYLFTFHHNSLHSSRGRATFTLPIFGARQSLDRQKLSLRNLLGLILSISIFTQRVYQNIPHSSSDRSIFIFFRIWQSAKPQPMINVILQFLGLDLFNIKLSAKFYQNIPNGLRVSFHFYQNLNLGKTLTNPKCHLTISRVTFCQYQCVCKIHHNIPFSSRDRTIFTFSEFGARQNLD